MHASKIDLSGDGLEGELGGGEKLWIQSEDWRGFKKKLRLKGKITDKS